MTRRVFRPQLDKTRSTRCQCRSVVVASALGMSLTDARTVVYSDCECETKARRQGVTHVETGAETDQAPANAGGRVSA